MSPRQEPAKLATFWILGGPHKAFAATSLHGVTCTQSFLYLVLVYYFFVPCGNFGSSYLGKAQQPQEQCYPFLSAWVVFSGVQTAAWLPVFGILHVCTNVGACDSTWGLYGHRKSVCTGSVGEKCFAAWGTQPCVSIVPGFLVRCSIWAILASHCSALIKMCMHAALTWIWATSRWSHGWDNKLKGNSHYSLCFIICFISQS